MTREGQLLDKKSLRAVSEKARCIRRECAAAHAIADLDLAQDASYPRSLRESHAPTRLKSRPTHCRRNRFSLARIFPLSQSTGHLPVETGTIE
jgi:hypothetical protein